MERTRNRNLWIGLIVIGLVCLVALPMLSGGGMFVGRGFEGYGVRPFGYGGGPFWGFWGIDLLFRVVTWGAILFFIVSLFRRRSFHVHDDASQPAPSSFEILRRRYAAGEITREQYDEMRRTLEARPSI